MRWGDFGGSVMVSGVCGLVLAEIPSWMLVVASGSCAWDRVMGLRGGRMSDSSWIVGFWYT